MCSFPLSVYPSIPVFILIVLFCLAFNTFIYFDQKYHNSYHSSSVLFPFVSPVFSTFVCDWFFFFTNRFPVFSQERDVSGCACSFRQGGYPLTQMWRDSFCHCAATWFCVDMCVHKMRCIEVPINEVKMGHGLACQRYYTSFDFFFGLKWVVWFATAYFSFVWQKIFSFICLNLPVHENDFLSCGNQIQNSILSCHIFHLRIERVRLQPLWPSPTILHMFKVTLAILFCFALSHTFLA